MFTSVPDLVSAIDGYIAHHNTKPKPFIWTKSATDILQKVIRANSKRLAPIAINSETRIRAHIVTPLNLLIETVTGERQIASNQ